MRTLRRGSRSEVIPAPQEARRERADQESLTPKLVGEANRLLTMSMFSAERHATAAGFFGNAHVVLGFVAAGLAAGAGGTAFAGSANVAGALAIGAAALAGLVTSLRPDERAQFHWSSSKDFRQLASDVHTFIEFPETAAEEGEFNCHERLIHRYMALEKASEKVSTYHSKKTAKRISKQDYYYPPLPLKSFAHWANKLEEREKRRLLWFKSRRQSRQPPTGQEP